MKRITVLFITIGLVFTSFAQTPPVISCPADIIVDNDLNMCTAIVNFDSATATDAEDGDLTTTQTMGLLSGSAFPVGESIIEFSATDTDSNTVTCQFSIIVNDVEAPIVVCKQDYEVDLDDDGITIVNAIDLISDITENCSYNVSTASTVCEQSNPTNGFENAYYTDTNHGQTIANDLVLEPNSNMTLTQVAANLLHTVGETISSIDLYYYSDNGGPDVLMGSQMGVIPTSQTVLGNAFGFDISTCLFDITPIKFIGDDTEKKYWIAMQATVSDGGTTAWEISTASSVGGGVYLYNGTTWTEQVGEDGVYSFTGLCSSSIIEFNCATIGNNTVDIVVTDIVGNEAICSATVIVKDVTAPEIVCGPDPVLSNSLLDTPETDIPDNDPNGVSFTIDVTDDFIITDINVPINITHTWIGDLLITLTSPSGMTVILKDHTGGGEDDIIEVYDDEGVLPVDALSIFDGQSTLGTWTLFVSDDIFYETGIMNSWGLEYTYDNPNEDLIFELDTNGEVRITAEDMTNTMYDACGFDVIEIDKKDFDCNDIGAPIMVSLFVNDTSGNFVSCQKEVTIVDNAIPDLICPDDTIEMGNNAGVFTLPDYFLNEMAYAIDNCTDDANIILTQNPAPGTEFIANTGIVHIITFTAEDENENIAICEFELLIMNHFCSVMDNNLDKLITLQPNPANNKVVVMNDSKISLNELLIYNIQGSLISQINLLNKQENTIDISKLKTGIYIFKIISNNESVYKTIIVE